MDWSKFRRFSESPKFLSLLTPGCLEFDGWSFHFIFHHCILQLLVYIRIAEFVCTLINIPLKCFDVLIAWFLGNPSTNEASWMEGSLLFIVLFLLVGIDPRLPAQGQRTLPSINTGGLKDLEQFCSIMFGRAVMRPSLPWNSGYFARLVSASSAPLPFPGLLGSLLRSWTKSAAFLTSA